MTELALDSLDDRRGTASPTMGLVGGLVMALGSLSVIVTSLFYVLSPPAAVAPLLHAPPDAMAAAIAGAATMRIAGTSGVFGNLVMAVGALLLAMDRAAARRPVAATGWAAIVMSIVVFEIVDCLVGFVLAPAAAYAGGAATFASFRSIFAVYFLVGTVLFGAGGLLALTGTATTNRWIRLLTWAGWFNGAIGVAVGLSTFAGVALPQFVGGTVGIGAIIFAAAGVAAASHALYAEPTVRRP